MKGETWADQIRAYPKMPAAKLAKKVGCSAHYVMNLRWRDANREHFRENNRRHSYAYWLKNRSRHETSA